MLRPFRISTRRPHIGASISATIAKRGQAANLGRFEHIRLPKLSPQGDLGNMRMSHLQLTACLRCAKSSNENWTEKVSDETHFTYV